MQTQWSRKVRLGLPVSLVLLLVSLPVSAQDTQIKIGFIDVKEIFDKAELFQKTFDELKQILRNKSGKLDQMEMAWVESREKFKVQKELLPPDKIREREIELETDFRKIFQIRKKEEETFSSLRDDKLKPVSVAKVPCVENICGGWIGRVADQIPLRHISAGCGYKDNRVFDFPHFDQPI